MRSSSQTTVGITIASAEGEWLDVNERFCGIVGYSQAELREKSILDITHPDDREMCLALIRRLLDGESASNTTEKRYVRKNGATAWVRLHLSLVRNQDNVPQYVVALAEDVTDRIAVCAFRDSEQRFALAVGAARLGLWGRDLSTAIIESSGEYARLYGLEANHPPLLLRVAQTDSSRRPRARAGNPTRRLS